MRLVVQRERAFRTVRLMVLRRMTLLDHTVPGRPIRRATGQAWLAELTAHAHAAHAPTHASRTNRRHHTPSATVAGYPCVASTLPEPPERLAAVRAQGVDAGRAAGAAEMDATAAAQRVGCGHRNVADDGGWRRERAWGARPAAPTSRPPCACARPVRCAPFGQRDVGGTSEMWQRARRGDEGRGRGRASEVRAGAPDGRRVDRSCWATRSARRRSCRTRRSSRSGCSHLQARNEAAQDSAVSQLWADGD